MINERSRDTNSTLDEKALVYIKKNGATNVQDLYDSLRVNNPWLSMSEVTDMVWRLVHQGKASLEDAQPPTKSMIQFLAHWEWNLPLYATLILSLATILVVYEVPDEMPFVALRWGLGLLFVLYIPGYAMLEALFPHGSELDTVIRFALNIGLSIVLVELIGLTLNFTPWEIRLTPIMISLTTFSVILIGIALIRKYEISTRSGTIS
ncbi:MAG TPA: DUF1616 domain-containing protein [Candidatus Bathyarchaeia archaeon]|nr:DUF1616 domain-containing protein [Candidatus Bathyarchaeia archaeon]